MLGKSRLDRKKIIVKRYINDGYCATGYFPKINFMNMLGLSTQMPIKLEIYMNNEQKRLREAPVGNQSILMCSART